MLKIETDRLIIRDLRISDANFILELLNDPAFINNIGDRQIRTEEQAIVYVQNFIIESYKKHGFGLYLVHLSHGIPIGICGLVKRTEFNYPDIGFAFLEKYRSKGYALESAERVLKYSLEELQLKNVLGITLASNHKSCLVLEKLGLSVIKTFNFKGKNNTLLYGLNGLLV